MPENIYEIISLGARYWFAFLGVLIVWRAFKWLRKDRRAKHRRLKHLPDAGMVGEMVVLQGSDELPEGTAIPVPREGVLGFLRTCDVVVPVEGVAGKHIDFVFQDGKGLLLFPLRKQSCILDEDTILTHRSKTKKHPMVHGSRLQIGEAVLRLRLFAGLDTEYRPYYADEQPYHAPFQEEPTDWQEAAYVYHQQPSPWADSQNPWQPEDEPLYDQPYGQPVYERPPQEASWLNQPPYPPQPYQPTGPYQPQQPYQPQPYVRRRRYHEE